MSLVRTMLRLTAIEALLPAAQLTADPPTWPTVAGKLVFDSLFDPVDDMASTDRKPTIVVYTEKDSLAKISQHGPVFYGDTVDIVIEIAIPSVIENPAKPGEIETGLPVTDAEAESTLDLLEYQIFHALNYGPTGALFRSMVKMPFDEWHSDPKRTSEENARLALRTIRGSIHLKEFCFEAAPDAVRTGLDRLPPGLKAIAAQLPAGSVAMKIMTSLSATAPVMPVATELGSISFQSKSASNPDIEMVDLTVDMELQSALAIPQVVAAGAAVTIDYARGRRPDGTSYQNIVLAADVTSVAIANWPGPGTAGRLVLQITNTGDFTLSGWPAGMEWAGHIAYAATAGAGAKDLIAIITPDSGTTLLGNVIGLDYGNP